MNTIRAVTDDDLPRDDQLALVAALRVWQGEGNENPMIPCDMDADGDGSTDAYGLGALGELVYVTGASLGDTVFEATGDSEEVPE